MDTECFFSFLDDVYERHVPGGERVLVRQTSEWMYGTLWCFTKSHTSIHSPLITDSFTAHPRMVLIFFPPYPPFLNPKGEFFALGRWKVYDHQPHDQMSVSDTMNAVHLDMSAKVCEGWIRKAKRFFPRCNTTEDIWCEVDENFWPNTEEKGWLALL